MRKAKPFGDLHHQRRAPPKNENSASWPNLPKRLIKYISDNPNTLKTLNFGVATKSWNPTTNKLHHNSSGYHRRATKTQARHVLVSGDPIPIQAVHCDIEFRRDYWTYWYKRNRWPHWNQDYPLGRRFTGCSHGVFFKRSSSSEPSQLHYFEPVEHRGGCFGNLPDNVPIACVAFSERRFGINITADPVLMVATGINSPAFMYVTSYEQAFSYFKPKKTNGDDMGFTNLIGFRGKFYALSSQGTLAVIDRVGGGDRFDITAHGKARVVPSVPFWGFKECLIESDGEILLVLLVSSGASSNNSMFDCVEIYRLRFKDLSWVKMESLGERTLFLGNDCCVSIYAEEVGCRRNCVYFMHRESDWFEFDVEFGKISRPWTDRAISSSGNPLEWDKAIVSTEDNWFNVYVGPI